MEEIINTRPQDMKQEPMVVSFLCDKIYPVIYGVHTTEVLDEDIQMDGIDVFLPDGTHDVKAQLKCYLCSPTNTFVVEVGAHAIKRDPVTNAVLAKYARDGWFLKDSLKTDFYDMVWIYQAEIEGEDNGKRLISPDGIYKAEMITVRKSDIRAYVGRHLTDSRIKEIVKAMRRRELGTVYIENGLRFVYSTKFAEAPINIVIPKLVYRKYAIHHVMYENGVVKELKLFAVHPDCRHTYKLSKKQRYPRFSKTQAQKKSGRVFSAAQRRQNKNLSAAV